jgi:glycosyltransferase involved in cell wall biosynthesis/SAM-dependent methyltransferase
MIKKIVHLVPYDGIGGVETAARSMNPLVNSAFAFEVMFIFKTVGSGYQRWATFSPLAIFGTVKRLIAAKTDVLIVSLWRSAIVGILAKCLHPKLKLVVFIHNATDVHWLDFIFTRLAIKLAHEVWVDSQASLRERVPNLGARKCRVISFVTQRFEPLPARELSADFIFWGRINAQKGLERALQLVADVVAVRPNSRFWIVGPDGGALHKIQQLRDSLKLTENVFFVGAATLPEIAIHAQKANFYLQTSHFEGMAMSVVEAMQLGLVPVVTPVGEIPSYCTHNVNALIVTTDTQTVDDLNALLNDADKYQAMQRDAIATWNDKPLYSESVASACGAMLFEDQKLSSVTVEESPMKNIDEKTVASFGDEWSRFDQSGMADVEAVKVFNEYFKVFPWADLPANAEGFDMGCGSGRWARWVAPRVGTLHCIDPSNAIDIAKRNLSTYNNLKFHRASVDGQCLPLNSQDFGYSLGVLHHVPDTSAAIRSCVDLLKPGAPLLLYLYYAFDNRPWWFRAIWSASDFGRRLIYRLHPNIKHTVTDAIALFIYFPLAMTSKAVEWLGCNVKSIPLSYYRKHSFYTMRTDARDRFGTPLEHRFTREQIANMMDKAGLRNIRFSDEAPFWCAVGFKT